MNIVLLSILDSVIRIYPDFTNTYIETMEAEAVLRNKLVCSTTLLTESNNLLSVIELVMIFTDWTRMGANVLVLVHVD